MARIAKGFIGGLLQRSNYAYANARVRVRKSKLLPRDSYAKLLKMDIPEITRFIEGTEYGREIDELASKFRHIDLLENALNVNEERNYAEVRSFVKGEVGDLVGRYLERFALWNLKTILRGRYWGAAPGDMVRELLIEDRADFDFYNALINAEGQGLKPIIEALSQTPKGSAYARLLREVESKISDEGMLLQAYEEALDRAYFTRLLETIRPDTPENTLFLQYVRKEMDTRNLQLLLRLKARPEPAENLIDRLLPAGYDFKDADLRRLAEAPTFQDLIERLKDYKVYNDIKSELEAYQPGASLTPIMIALTRSLADFVQRFSYRNPLSVLPIINYLMRKNLEVRNLRAVARGKQAGLSETDVENLLVMI